MSQENQIKNSSRTSAKISIWKKLLKWSLWGGSSIMAIPLLFIALWQWASFRTLLTNTGLSIAKNYLAGEIHLSLGGDLLSSLEVRDFRWNDCQGHPMIALKKLEIKYDLLSFIASGFSEFHVQKVLLQDPKLHLTMQKGELNLLRHIKKKSDKKEEKKEEESGPSTFVFKVSPIDIRGLQLLFEEDQRKIKIRDLNLGLDLAMLGPRLRVTLRHLNFFVSNPIDPKWQEIHLKKFQLFFWMNLDKDLLKIKDLKLLLGSRTGIFLKKFKMKLGLIPKLALSSMTLFVAKEDLQAILPTLPPLPDIHLEARAKGSLEDLKTQIILKMGHLSLHLRSWVALLSQKFDIHLSLKNLNLAELLGKKEMKSHVDLLLTAKGQGFSEKSVGEATLKIPSGYFQQYKFEQLLLSLKMNRGKIEIQRLSLKTPYAQFTGRGKSNIIDGTCRVIFSGKVPSLRRIGKLIHQPLRGKIHFNIFTRCLKDWKPRVSLFLTMKNFRYPSVRFAQLNLKARLKNLEPIEASIDHLELHRIVASGKKIRHFATELLFKMPQGEQHITLKRFQFRLGKQQFKLKKIVWVRLAGQKLHLSPFILKAKRQSIEMGGKIDLSGRGQSLFFRIRSLSLRPLLQSLDILPDDEIQGLFSLNFRLDGSLYRPQFALQASLKRGRFRRFFPLNFQLALRYKNRQFHLSRCQLLHGKNSLFQLKARLPIRLNFKNFPRQPLYLKKSFFVRMNIPSLTLDWLGRVLKKPLKGRIKATIHLSHNLSDPVLYAKIGILGFAWTDLQNIDIDLFLRYRRGLLEFPKFDPHQRKNWFGKRLRWLTWLNGEYQRTNWFSYKGKPLLSLGGKIPLVIRLLERRHKIVPRYHLLDRKMNFYIKLHEQHFHDLFDIYLKDKQLLRREIHEDGKLFRKILFLVGTWRIQKEESDLAKKLRILMNHPIKRARIARRIRCMKKNLRLWQKIENELRLLYDLRRELRNRYAEYRAIQQLLRHPYKATTKHQRLIAKTLKRIYRTRLLKRSHLRHELFLAKQRTLNKEVQWLEQAHRLTQALVASEAYRLSQPILRWRGKKRFYLKSHYFCFDRQKMGKKKLSDLYARLYAQAEEELYNALSGVKKVLLLNHIFGIYRAHLLLSGSSRHPYLDLSFDVEKTSFCPWEGSLPRCERKRTHYYSAKRRELSSFQVNNVNFNFHVHYRSKGQDLPAHFGYIPQNVLGNTGRLGIKTFLKFAHSTLFKFKTIVAMDFSIHPKTFKTKFQLHEPISLDFRIPRFSIAHLSKFYRSKILRRLAGALNLSMNVGGNIRHPKIQFHFALDKGRYLWGRNEDDKPIFIDNIQTSINFSLNNGLGHLNSELSLFGHPLLREKILLELDLGLNPKNYHFTFKPRKRFDILVEFPKFSLKNLEKLGGIFGSIAGILDGKIRIKGDLACPIFEKGSRIAIRNGRIGYLEREKKKKVRALLFKIFYLTFETLKDGRAEINFKLRRYILRRLFGKTKRGTTTALAGMIRTWIPMEEGPRSLKEWKRRCPHIKGGRFSKKLEVNIGTLGAAIPLKFLETFVQGLVFDGTFNTSILMQGTYDHPVIRKGRIGIDIRRMLYRPYGVEILSRCLKRPTTQGNFICDWRNRRSKFYLLLEPDRYRIDGRLLGKQGKQFRMSGEMPHKNFVPQSIKMKIDSEDFRPMVTPRYRLQLVTRIRIKGRLNAPQIRGTIKIPQMLFTIPESSHKPGDFSEDPDIIVRGEASERRYYGKSSTSEYDDLLREKGLLDRMLVDLMVIIPRNFWVKNRDISIEAKTDEELENLHILLKKGRLQIRGGIKFVRGQLQAYGKRFLVSPGSGVTFTGQSFSLGEVSAINPLLGIVAKYTITVAKGSKLYKKGHSKVDVLLKVTGAARSPKIDFEVRDAQTKDKIPLDRINAISLILTGSTTDDLSQGQQQNLANQAVGMVGRLISSELKTALSGIVPLDVLKLETGTRLQDLQVEVGWYLTPTLYTEFALKPVPLNEESLWEARLNWAINRHWSLEARSGHFKRNDSLLFRVSGYVYFKKKY